MKRLTVEEFILKAIKVHGDKYDYSNVVYKGSKEKVYIICHEKDENGVEHGGFWQIPDNHIKGHGCPKCSKNRKYTKEEVIELSNKTHHNEYDYSLCEYVNMNTKIMIICHKKDKYGVEHGVFFKTPNKHIYAKCGCPKCSGRNKTTKYIVDDFIGIHDNMYDYSNVVFEKINKKVCIICHKKDEFGNEHGEFFQTPNNHLHGKGCPKCKQSFLEKEVMQMLNKNNIIFECEKKFNWLKYEQPLRLDFYLPNYNIAIECQGLQHFEPNEHFGGNEEYIKVVERDKIKYNLCKKNNIKLYYYSNIIKEDYFDKIYNDIDIIFKEIVIN